MKIIDIMPSDSFYVIIANNQNSRMAFSDISVDASKILFSNYNICLKSYSGKKGIINIRADVLGISDMGDNTVTKYGNMRYITPISLQSGRMITAKDSLNKNHVVVIDEATAYLMYGSLDVIGKKINIKSANEVSGNTADNIDYGYEIVGVLENSTYQRLILKDAIKKYDTVEGETNIFSTVYIPYSCFTEMYGTEIENQYLLWNSVPGERKPELYNDINTIMKQYPIYTMSSRIQDKQYFADIVASEIKPYKFVVNTVITGLIILSGINSMSIFIFSVKERIREIGIRKAFGANGTDIVFQFTIEGVMTALIGVLLSVTLSYLIAAAVLPLLSAKLNIDMSLAFNGKYFVFAAAVATLQSIVFTFIPSVYASKIPVTKALRFE